MPGAVKFFADQIRSSWNHADLKARIITPVMIVMAIITGFAGMSFYHSEQSKLMEELSLRGQAISASLSAYASSPMLQDRKQDLETHVKHFIEDKQLLYQVAIYKGDQDYLKVTSGLLREQIRPETLKHYRVPIYSPDEKEIGSVEVTLSTQQIENYLGVRIFEITAVVVLVVLVSMILLSWLLSQVVIQPLERLTHKIQIISMGRLNDRVVSMSWDEIGHLFRDINALRIRFKRQENELISAIINRKKVQPDDVPETQARALVVDDDEVIQMHARALLSKNNIDVTLAANGKQAMEKLATDSFDLILLDLVMPEMSGYEVLQAIKQQPSCNDIPIIVVSSVTDKASIVKALNKGATDFIIKPFDNNEFIARINIHLSAALREKEINNIVKERIASLR